ncbi:MAG: hypothetical protein II931_06610 [Clostridia bacterium]|nr:hypothetical protein [Clostridia bacterium]
MINIRFDELSERDIWEAECKGYLCGLKAEIDGKTYLVNVYSIARLQHDFEYEMECSGYYVPDPNLIIVDTVTPDRIKFTMENMYKDKYFVSFEGTEGDFYVFRKRKIFN